METPSHNILIVDDNELNRRILEKTLKGISTSIAMVNSGEEALVFVHNRKPDLVLLDVVMDGISGIEVLLQLRERFSQLELPIIMVTANNESKDIAKAFSMGANDYISKPFEPLEVQSRVRSALTLADYHKLISSRNKIIERELDMATLIQKKLLPEKDPEIPNYKVSSLYIPMDKVGGDYYDYIITPDRFDLLIADVSGHGVPGAFIATILKITLQSTRLRNFSPKEVIEILDKSVYERAANGMFATAFFSRIDLLTNTITYCNAGHCPIFLHRRKDNTFHTLTMKGMPLGIYYDFSRKKKDMAITVGSFDLEPGDRIFYYTDAITECEDPSNVAYGDERLLDFLKLHRYSPADSLEYELMKELKSFSGKESFDDDLTMVVVDYSPESLVQVV